jgi:carboxyl-terminal processing protease
MPFGRFRLFLIIAISLVVGYGLGTTKIAVDWQNYRPNIAIASKQPPPSITEVDMQRFWDTWDKLATLYYDRSKIDPQKMLDGAINGLTQSVNDPFTTYLPPVQNDAFKDQLAGQFEGIGAELKLKNERVTVLSPLNGSPAIRSGILPGDIILKVGDEDTQGWTLTQAVQKIRGPKGTTITLTIGREGQSEPLTIPVTRDIITVKSVDGYVKDVATLESVSDDIKKQFEGRMLMYVRLSQFGDSTNNDWTALISSLASQNPRIDGMVLDLRNNPGGYLTDAAYIMGDFVPTGTTVVIQEQGDTKKELKTSRSGQLMNIPLVVLINGGSASASEIVAGALRDYKRAQLVGETTFGKGTIQQALDLGQGAGLHVTIAKWLTPKGTWVHDTGLEPDVVAAYEQNRTDGVDTQLEEAIRTLYR